MSPNTGFHTLSMQLLESRIVAVIGNVPHTHKLTSRSKLVRDLQQFNEITVYRLGMKTNQHVLTSSVSHGVWTQPSLMHFALAVSNAHTKRLYSTDSNADLQKHLSIAETVHWQIALQLYHRDLQNLGGDDGLYSANEDTVVTSTYLLTVLASCIDDEIPLQLFIRGNFSSMTSAMAPITAAGSLQSLTRIAPGLQSRSAWKGILHAMANSSTPLSLEELPPAFVELCELATEPDLTSNLYYQMLCNFAPILRLEPCLRQIATLFGLIGNVWPELQGNIIARDRRTLLLFSWWLALTRRLDVWWIATRATTTCLAIVAYLSKVGSEKLKPFLAFPASLAVEDCAWIWDAAAQVLPTAHDQRCTMPDHLMDDAR